MTQRRPSARTSTEVIADRVRHLMEVKHWTAQQLVDALAQVGIEWTRAIVANLLVKKTDRRRRFITVDELYALAYVLDVAPIHLMVPIDSPQGDALDRIAIVSTQAAQPTVMRAWIRGLTAIGAQDPRRYFSEVPTEEWQPKGAAEPWSPAAVAAQRGEVREDG